MGSRPPAPPLVPGTRLRLCTDSRVRGGRGIVGGSFEPLIPPGRRQKGFLPPIESAAFERPMSGERPCATFLNRGVRCVERSGGTIRCFRGVILGARSPSTPTVVTPARRGATARSTRVRVRTSRGCVRMLGGRDHSPLPAFLTFLISTRLLQMFLHYSTRSSLSDEYPLSIRSCPPARISVLSR